MGFFLETLIGGLMAGMLYSLVALGFVLIFKASGVFNFAQGAMVLFAALAMARAEDVDYQLSGVPRMHERPIGDLVDALRQLGCPITCLGREGYPPLRVGHGTPVVGADVRRILGLAQAAAVDLGGESGQIGHVGAQGVGVERNQTSVALGHHANGSARVENQQFHSPKICRALRLVTAATSLNGTSSCAAKCSATRRT